MDSHIEKKFNIERMTHMPLNSQDQAAVLKDILSNHQTDCCGSVAECEQVERLVKSLMAHTGINQNVKGILQDIYEYGQHGAQSADLDNHIQAHQGQLSNWVSDIDQFSGQL
jgi:hypothetical protein